MDKQIPSSGSVLGTFGWSTVSGVDLLSPAVRQEAFSFACSHQLSANYNPSEKAKHFHFSMLCF